MNPPPNLKPLAAAQLLTATGTVAPETVVPGARTELVFSLPLPTGFTISPTSEWMVTLPPGFTLPAPGSAHTVSFFGLSPYQYDSVLSPPSMIGPTTAPIDDFPTGTLWVWSALNNMPEYSGITLQSSCSTSSIRRCGNDGKHVGANRWNGLEPMHLHRAAISNS